MEAEAGRALPDDVLSLAINSIHGRSQDQLHIHIDCIARRCGRSFARMRRR